jgi:hypothetical protein
VNSVMQEGMQVGDNLSLQGAAEEDDIARAISDSLKTAEEEKALRELGEASGPFFMEEIEDTDSGAKQSGYLRDLCISASPLPSPLSVVSCSKPKLRLIFKLNSTLICQLPS